ncbi:hypothetical protein POPTR_002G081500v4 [Populus trichocarpa]|uniref:Uncharacterized protein n=1 Tax=Populus trichocarpa TaxID=3694 RepID=A0ACC0TCM9_POPTR|nr:hypothetical protein BDE02_02G074500 [Populus trichocarpa]KAI9399344.1 hypothetical protein POPTR_002G081500v4 [Populus trichocarpa]
MDERQPVSSLEEPKRDESVAAETPSFLPRTGPNSFLSKHRMAAAITQLQSQISSIQEELDQLDTFGESSIVCKETQGPVNASWDRWFKGNQNSRRRWI